MILVIIISIVSPIIQFKWPYEDYGPVYLHLFDFVWLDQETAWRLVDSKNETDTEGDTAQLIADILYHICLNFIGWWDVFIVVLFSQMIATVPRSRPLGIKRFQFPWFVLRLCWSRILCG